MTDFNYGYLSPFLQMQYQQYLPNVFDDSLSLYEQVKRLEGYLNNTLIAFNESTGKISTDMQTFSALITAVRDDVTGFKEQMENEVLPENLIAILETWLANGQLATILTTELLNNKANTSDFELLVTQVGEIDADMVALGTELNEDLTAGLADITAQTNSKLTQLSVPVLDYLSEAELTDIQLETPLLDHTDSIQAYVNAMRTAGNYNLYFPRGTYRFKGVNLGSDPWYIFGDRSPNGYIHNTTFMIISSLNAVGFNSSARNIAFSDFGAVSTGTVSDGFNTFLFKNLITNGQFINAERIYGYGLSGGLFDTIDLIDSTFEQIHADYVGSIVKARLGLWTRNTTIHLIKVYGIHCTNAIDMPNTTESKMDGCIFEFCDKVGNIKNGKWTITDCYIENNVASLDGTDSQLIKIHNYYNTLADYISNTQNGLDYLHRGEVEIYHGGAMFSRFSKHYEVAGNVANNNSGTDQWHRLGVWYTAGGGSRLQINFMGGQGFGQQVSGDGLLGGNGVTQLFATFTGNGNPSLPAISAFAFHTGSAKPITAIKIVAKDAYFDKFDVYVKMPSYASKIGYEVEISVGYFLKDELLNTIDPGSANANLVDVPFEFKIVTGTGSFEVTPDGGLKFVAPTIVGGTAPATVDQYMWVQINGTYYKIPLYL